VSIYKRSPPLPCPKRVCFSTEIEPRQVLLTEINYRKQRTLSMFLSRYMYRNMSGCLGEQEMQWKLATVATALYSSSKL